MTTTTSKPAFTYEIQTMDGVVLDRATREGIARRRARVLSAGPGGVYVTVVHAPTKRRLASFHGGTDCSSAQYRAMKTRNRRALKARRKAEKNESG